MDTENSEFGAVSSQTAKIEPVRDTSQPKTEISIVGQDRRQRATNVTKSSGKTKHKKQLMLIALRKNQIVSHAAELAGIDRATHYRWLKSDVKYKQDVDNVDEELKDMLEKMAYTLALVDKNPRVLLATLRAKASDRGWGDDPKVTTQANEGFQLTIVTAGELPKEIKKVKEEEKAEQK